MLNPVEREDLIYTLSISRYIRSLGFQPYEWQQDVLASASKRKVINGARQSGKSTIVSAKPCHRARFFPGSLSIVVAATEQQANYDLDKVRDFISRDRGYPEVVRDADGLIELGNRSQIIVVPATPKSARGPSSPDLIVMDEASRIEDLVYTSGVRPMLTDNAKCEMILISTPNGRRGFFFKAMQHSHWERFEVRAPWDVEEVEWRLYKSHPEQFYKEHRAAKGVRAYYSPRHFDLHEQQENLDEMGPMMYRQEYLVEFVEPEEQAFAYEDIERAFEAGKDVQPMKIGRQAAIEEADIEPLELRR